MGSLAYHAPFRDSFHKDYVFLLISNNDENMAADRKKI